MLTFAKFRLTFVSSYMVQMLEDAVLMFVCK